MRTEFIVPAVVSNGMLISILETSVYSANLDLSGGNLNPGISNLQSILIGSRSRVLSADEETSFQFRGFKTLQRQLPNQTWCGLKMNLLMLDSHHNGPEWVSIIDLSVVLKG